MTDKTIGDSERHPWADEIIAFVNGEVVEARYLDDLSKNIAQSPWFTLAKDGGLRIFDSPNHEFRIAPKKKRFWALFDKELKNFYGNHIYSDETKKYSYQALHGDSPERYEWVLVKECEE